MAVVQPTPLLEPEISVTRSLDASCKQSPYRSSKLPRVPLSPELDKKLKLITGYQSLLRLEVVAACRKPPETKKIQFLPQLGKNDSMQLIQLRRSLLASRKCRKCRKSLCACQVSVPDKPLEQMTRRFSQVRSRLASIPASVSKRIRSQSVLPEIARYRIVKTEAQGYKLSFKLCASHSPLSSLH